jgi:chromosome partitioning protein
VISIASSKGGVGKTTLASALAVRAARDSPRVAMVDLDPQLSLAAWWKRRGGSKNPQIFSGADTASDAVEALERDGWDWVFVDTPPAFLATIQDAIENADLALVPLRASALDLIASEDAVIMAREAGVAHLCVVNDAEPKWKTTNSARDYLLAAHVPVAETIISHRNAYLAAMSSGKTGPEIERRDTKCSEEIDTLWSEIKQALSKGKRKRHG